MRTVILRGPPGCGKSTFIRDTFASLFVPDTGVNAVICSADNFFCTNPGGEYRFDRSKLSQAHSWCMSKFLSALKHKDVTDIFVDNTNIHIWEYENYIRAAELVGCIVEIVEITVNTVEAIRKCASRNVHGVPIEVIARMVTEFESYSGPYKCTVQPMGG